MSITPDFLNDDFFPSIGGVPKGWGGSKLSEGRDGSKLSERWDGSKLSEGRDGSKLPKSLQEIINDEEKRKKLVIYINPPYAEATSAKTVSGSGQNKAGVTTNYKIKQHYNKKIGNASNEYFALFMATVYEKIPNSKLALFSTLKFIQGTNFRKFKEFFQAEYLNGFVVPAATFDNVKGKFPIGFTIWDTNHKSEIKTILTDIFDKKGNYVGVKKFYGELPEIINKWIVQFRSDIQNIGYLTTRGNDFQNNNFIQIISDKNLVKSDRGVSLNKNNLIPISIYLSTRHCIEATWLNDRDQFLTPNDNWQTDKEFQNDCLAFTLFHSQNKIQLEFGTNHWIPFTEQEVNASEKFASNFMTDFINGKLQPTKTSEKELFENETAISDFQPREFSEEATAVFTAGRSLWQYYHAQKGVDVNASLYDIRAYFQGRNAKGRMNSRSDDEHYMLLIGKLRNKLQMLGDKIVPKVYAFGFLKG